MAKKPRKDKKGKGPSPKSKGAKGKSAGTKSGKKSAKKGTRRAGRPSTAGDHFRKKGAPQKRSGRRKPVSRQKGLFEGHERGFGFVRPEVEDHEDIFIPPNHTDFALHNDRVEVDVFEEDRPGRRFWGKIVRVLEQSDRPVVGYFDGRQVVPRDSRYQAWIRVAPHDTGDAEEGDMVVAEVTKRSPKGVFGRITEVLGKEPGPETESRIVLFTYGFTEEFPAEVFHAVDRVPDEVREEDRAGREDLRGRFTMTIDPVTAKDFDDALSIEKTDKGYRLWVSIADVSHYVTPGSPIDDEAYERATSVYFPDRSIPMLPHELSSNICSLMPRVERLAMTAEMDFDKTGKRTNARFYTSVIKSDHRLAYEWVEEMEHDEGKRKEFEGAWPAIELLRELMNLRRKRRFRRGALDLDMPEAKIVLDNDGRVVDVIRQEQTWSHRLVEECMLVANEAVASFMESRNQPMVYRIHEPPAPIAVDDLSTMLAPLGFQLLKENVDPEEIGPSHYQKVIDQSKGTKYERLVKTLCLRSMMQARYSPDNAGHFGLASDNYCHFTSPIRRYPDLIVHRLLKKELGITDREGKSLSLAAASYHCSERERASASAEREMDDLYSVIWMESHLGNEFKGVVSGVTSFGMFVELDEVFIEGMVPAEWIDDRVWFDEDNMLLKAPSTGDSFRIGDRVLVSAHSADRIKRRVTFELVEKLS